MKFEKNITLNLGNYQSLKLGVSDAPSFEECDQFLIKELIRLGQNVDDRVHMVLKWEENKSH